MSIPIFVARQGDVAILRFDGDPAADAADPIPREHGRVILAHGEVTGHAHAITEAHVEHRQLTPAARDRVARDASAVITLLRVIGQDAWLRHEEHAPVHLPPGDFLAVRQVEYVPRAVPRTVAD